MNRCDLWSFSGLTADVGGGVRGNFNYEREL